MRDLDNLVGRNDSFDAVLFPWKVRFCPLTARLRALSVSLSALYISILLELLSGISFLSVHSPPPQPILLTKIHTMCQPVNFFRWYNTYFYPFIHSHHGVEEKIVMPWFARKGIKLPQKVQK